jgi:hypothetical protein
MPCHEVFGKPLAPLQSRGALCGPEDGQPVPLECIDDPAGKRLLGSDNCQVDLFTL